MLYGWTEKQLKDAIERCTRDIEGMIKRHESPEVIYRKRKVQEQLQHILDEGREKDGN